MSCWMCRSILSEATDIQKCQSCADIWVHWWQAASGLLLLRPVAVSACWCEAAIGRQCSVGVLWRNETGAVTCFWACHSQGLWVQRAGLGGQEGELLWNFDNANHFNAEQLTCVYDLCVLMITLQQNDLWPRYLACWFTVMLSRSCL